MGIFRIDLLELLHIVWRYALAVLFVAAAAGIARLINPRIGESTAALFFAAVILSAWTGGLGPGLLATAIAGYVASAYYRLNPVGSLGIGWDDGLQVGVFVAVALLISSLTSMRQHARSRCKSLTRNSKPGFRREPVNCAKAKNDSGCWWTAWRITRS